MAQRRTYSSADAVASAALFFGKDTTRSNIPIEIFRDPANHATATASILVYSARITGFEPSEKSADSLTGAVGAFEEKASTFPGFATIGKSASTFALKDRATAIEFERAIRDSLKDIPHIDKIAFKFAELVPQNVEPEKTSLKNWILNLVIIDKPENSDSVRIQLAHILLEIAFDKTTAYIPKQEVTVYFSDFRLLTSVLATNAKRFAELVSIVDVENTIAFFASPVRNGLESEPDRLFTWLSQQRVLSF